jgi:predicted Zn-dependent protease
LIRLVTLQPYDPKQLERLTKALYSAFGVGCEHAGEMELPSGIGNPVDAEQLLDRAPRVLSYADDKVLYLTGARLNDRALASGTAPTSGFSRYGKDKAVVTSAVVKDFEQGQKTVTRHAMHQLGHLWELHHCLDPRCAMYPPWTPSYNGAEPTFCTFCRDKSEQKLRNTKS